MYENIKITYELISKTKDNVNKTMVLWRELKLHVTPSARLFEDQIVYQMKNMVGGLADKSEDYFERYYQND